MEKYYQNSLGVWKQDDGVHEVTQLRMTPAEYKKYLDTARAEAREEMRKEYESTVNAAKAKYEESTRLWIKEREEEKEVERAALMDEFDKAWSMQREAEEQAEEKAKQILAKAEKDADLIRKQAEDTVKQSQKFYRGFERIMRERKNAARNIPNKKQHHGYIALRVDTISYRDQSGRYADAWATTIQTPYDAGMDLESVQMLVWDGMDFNLAKAGGILKGLGIRYVADEEEKGYYNKVKETVRYRMRRKAKKNEWDFGWDDDEEEELDNFLFDWKFSADFIRGVWNITLYHSKQATITESIRKPSSY